MRKVFKTQKRDPDPGLLDVVWAIVLIQGAITLLTAFEATIGSFALGSIAVAGPVIGLSIFGGALALASARGLRLRRRWARKVTVIAEYLVLGSGVLALVASLVLAQRPAGAGDADGHSGRPVGGVGAVASQQGSLSDH